VTIEKLEEPIKVYGYPFKSTNKKIEIPEKKEYAGKRKKVQRDEKSEIQGQADGIRRVR
jgi:hypothetical protein